MDSDSSSLILVLGDATHVTRHAPRVFRCAPAAAVAFAVEREVEPACMRHTSHVPRHKSHTTHNTSHVTRHTSHVTWHTSHVPCHKSHVTRHTSHVTRHTARTSSVSSPTTVSASRCVNNNTIQNTNAQAPGVQISFPESCTSTAAADGDNDDSNATPTLKTGNQPSQKWPSERV